ncbi:hypothetical protein GCM10023199_04730 [Actinomycetospora chibensis]
MAATPPVGVRRSGRGLRSARGVAARFGKARRTVGKIVGLALGRDHGPPAEEDLVAAGYQSRS